MGIFDAGGGAGDGLPYRCRRRTGGAPNAEPNSDADSSRNSGGNAGAYTDSLSDTDTY